MRFIRKTFVIFTRSLLRQLALLFIASLLLSALPVFLQNRELRLNVGLVDEDRTEESAALAGNAEQDALFSVSRYNSPLEALNLVKSGSLEALFVIRRGYAAELSKGNYKGVIEAVYSPYSASVKTLSDAFGALVLRELMRKDAYARAAEKLPRLTAEEFGRVFEAAGGDILSLEVVPAGATAPPEQPAPLQLPFYLLSLAAMFYMLCAVKLPQNMPALLERIQKPGGFLFAWFGVHTLPFLTASAVLSVCLAFTFPAALAGFPAFLLYLLALVGLLSASSLLPLSDSARICLAAAFSLLNAVFAYPAGLAASSALRFLFPAAMLQSALTLNPLYFLYTAAYAGVFLFLGAALRKRK
jgi:hypothetical protein